MGSRAQKHWIGGSVRAPLVLKTFGSLCHITHNGKSNSKAYALKLLAIISAVFPCEAVGEFCALSLVHQDVEITFPHVLRWKVCGPVPWALETQPELCGQTQEADPQAEHWAEACVRVPRATWLLIT